MRLKFAKDHVDKRQEFWNKINWSNETKINLFGSDGIYRICRQAKQDNNVRNTLPTVKHVGGSVILWGCMSANMVRNMEYIDGIMNKTVYNKIFKKM